MRDPLQKQVIRPERLLCQGFLVLIFIGGVLLATPAAANAGTSIGLGNGLFTAISAVCVTGLIVVDTGTTFSLFGQLVLLGLIQTGGLGFMIFATMMMAALGRRVTLQDRLLMRESLSVSTLSGLVRLSCWYGLLAALLELCGAVVLSVRFVPLYGWSRGMYYALWHAVSAFCNAGFDLFGGFGSLTAFERDPLVLLTVAALIILGGTGFAVLSEVMAQRFQWRRFSLHAKLVLLINAAFLVAGTLFFLLAEWRNPKSLGAVEGWGHRLMNALFQSVTMRTAGFNSIDLASLTDGTKLFCVLLMLVGASPASTGGGMKTTTVAVVLLAVSSTIRGKEDVVVLKRRLPWGLVRRAFAVLMVTLTAYLAGTLALTVAESGGVPFVDLLFEAASAMGTVGVTSSGTASLSGMSRVVLALMMYLGRVGPLTLATALASRQEETRGALRYPEEPVTIG